MSEYIIECDYDVDVGFVPGEMREEIVRCRDCRHYDLEWTSEVYPLCHWCEYHAHYVTPDGFCAWGVKQKEGGE